MYYQEEADKKEKRKIIAVVTTVTVVILILIVAIILVATNKTSRSQRNVEYVSSESKEDEQIAEQTSDEAIEEDDADEAQEESSVIGELTTEKSTGNGEENTSEESVPATSVNAVVVAESSDNMPATGAEDLLPLALMLGAAAVYIGSRKFAKEN